VKNILCTYPLCELLSKPLPFIILHSATTLPESRVEMFGSSQHTFGVGASNTGVLPFMGGSTDKLMSNHVYELGVALHILGILLKDPGIPWPAVLIP